MNEATIIRETIEEESGLYGSNAGSRITQAWWLFFALGAVITVLGIMVIALPLAGTLAVEGLVGMAMVLIGASQIVHAFFTRGWKGETYSALCGLLYLAVGICLFVFPIASMITITVLLAVTFLFEGIFEIMMALYARPEQGWGWVMLSGIAAFVVALLIWTGLPSSAVWAIGLLVGINMISSGLSMIMLSMAARPMVKTLS